MPASARGVFGSVSYRLPATIEVEIAVAVDVVHDDAADRRDLRRFGQRRGREDAAAVVVQIDAGEGVGLVMHRLLELRRREELRIGCVGERAVRGKLEPERVDLAAERRVAGDWILGPVDRLRQDDVGAFGCP